MLESGAVSITNNSSTTMQQTHSGGIDAMGLTNIILSCCTLSIVVVMFVMYMLRSRRGSRQTANYTTSDDVHKEDIESLPIHEDVVVHSVKIRALRVPLGDVFSSNGYRLPMGTTDGSPAAHCAIVYSILQTIRLRQIMPPLHASYRERFDEMLDSWIKDSSAEKREWILGQLDLITSSNISKNTILRSIEDVWSAYSTWRSSPGLNCVDSKPKGV